MADLEATGGYVWQQTLDHRLTSILLKLLTEHRAAAGTPWSPELLISVTADVIQALKLPGGEGRHRSVRQRLACMAGVYAGHFAPEKSWKLCVQDDAPGHLVWRTGKGLVVDVPRASGIDAPVVTQTLQQELPPLVKQLADTHSTKGVRVRVLPLAAPGLAVWFDPQTGQHELLHARSEQVSTAVSA